MDKILPEMLVPLENFIAEAVRQGTSSVARTVQCTGMSTLASKGAQGNMSVYINIRKMPRRSESPLPRDNRVTSEYV